MKTALLTLTLLATSIAYGAQASPEANTKLDQQNAKCVITDPIELIKLYDLFNGFACNTKGPNKLPNLMIWRIRDNKQFTWQHVKDNFHKLWEMLETESKIYKAAPQVTPFYFATKVEFFEILKKQWFPS